MQGIEYMEYWQTHFGVAFYMLLIVLALAAFYFPRIALRHRQKFSRDELVGVSARLRRICTVQKGWLWITSGATIVALWQAYEYTRRGSDESNRGFLMAAALAILPLSDGVFALLTGVYQNMAGRWFLEEYFYDPEGERKWIPWTQTIAGLLIGAISLVVGLRSA